MPSIEHDTIDYREHIVNQCAAQLIDVISAAGIERYCILASRVSRDGRALSEWLVTIERIPAGMMN